MLLIFIVFNAISIYALENSFDLNGGIQGRTLPAFGAELYLEGGYNELLWGKRTNSKDILFGLVRPSFGISTSGVINSAKAELEVFPISFIGLVAGRQYLESNFDFPFFDCEAVSCKGSFERNYTESRVILGAKGWIALGSYRIDKMNSRESRLPLADWRNVIVGESRRDIQIEKKLLLGKIISNELFGLLIENVQFLGSRERKESFMGVYQLSTKSNSYMIGGGLFHTDREPMGFQIYFRVNRNFLPSSKLF